MAVSMVWSCTWSSYLMKRMEDALVIRTSNRPSVAWEMVQ